MNRIFRVCVLLVAANVANALEKRGPTSIEQVAAACDSTEDALTALLEASQSRDAGRPEPVVTLYIRSLSNFHTQLARLQPVGQESGFLQKLALRLNSQLNAMKELTENAQPALATALNEATSHLKGALELVNHTMTMNKRRSPKISIRGPESTNPGARYPRF
jgi:hypothetical protein